MRVRHLLSMSTGNELDTMPALHDRQDGDWIKAFLACPVEREPGTHFVYNTGATYMLSAIIQKITGMKLIDYLTPRLIEPLGIEDSWWEESPQGINTGGFGYNIKTEDIACFGQMYLQKGKWNGKQILPEAWVEQASAKQVPNDSQQNIDWRQGYGFQFWRCQPHGAYRGDGAFGQYCVIMPEQDAVLAITSAVADMQQPLTLAWDLLLPAMKASALAEDAAGQAALKAKLARLTLPPPTGSASVPMAAKVSGRNYKADANDVNIETVCFDFAESSFTAVFNRDGKDYPVTGGYSRWQEGETRFFSRPQDHGEAKVVVSGVWTSDDTFTMTTRLYETPFFVTTSAKFNGDQVELDSFPNVAFVMKHDLVTAKAR